MYSSPDIIRQIKLRRMRWAGHVAPMGEERNVLGREGNYALLTIAASILKLIRDYFFIK
jgi:hypothetical protein